MPCYHPLKCRQRSPGDRPRFGANAIGRELRVACGQCIGCRLNNAREWALRSVHESQMHEQNSFVTLTYSDEALNDWEDAPWRRSYSVHPREHQLFLKRLRKRLDTKLRYLLCGEYGDETSRPHYHFLAFGHDWIEGGESVGSNAQGDRLWAHPDLTEAWGLGNVVVGRLTWRSCAYVANYVTKKITGKRAKKEDPSTGLLPYEWVDTRSGEIHTRHPEYVRASRNKGIGRGWFEAFQTDVYPSDQVVIGGRVNRPPRYYDQIMGEAQPAFMEALKERRREHAMQNVEDNTPERLSVRELIATKADREKQRGL